MVWAALQLAAPGASAIADGSLASGLVVERTAHVEDTTSATCPTSHPPDCAVCRYLSTGATLAPAVGASGTHQTAMREPGAECGALHSVAVVLPDGRAPPAI